MRNIIFHSPFDDIERDPVPPIRDQVKALLNMRAVLDEPIDFEVGDFVERKQGAPLQLPLADRPGLVLEIAERADCAYRRQEMPGVADYIGNVLVAIWGSDGIWMTYRIDQRFLRRNPEACGLAEEHRALLASAE